MQLNKATFELGKKGLELSAKTIQEYGSQLTSLIPGLDLGKTKLSCGKCKKALFLHTFYGANDNYSQCNGCGKNNQVGAYYLYCETCSPWGFCGNCAKNGIVPYGCDTRSCGKCGKNNLKSSKFYGANLNYKCCNLCGGNIGLNNFYWYCTSCNTYGYCYPCTLAGRCGLKV